MSAQELRAAAAKMREDHPWDQPHLDGIFYNAVADFLEECADDYGKGYGTPDAHALAITRAYLNQ